MADPKTISFVKSVRTQFINAEGNLEVAVANLLDAINPDFFKNPPGRSAPDKSSREKIADALIRSGRLQLKVDCKDLDLPENRFIVDKHRAVEKLYSPLAQFWQPFGIEISWCVNALGDAVDVTFEFKNPYN